MSGKDNRSLAPDSGMGTLDAPSQIPGDVQVKDTSLSPKIDPVTHPPSLNTSIANAGLDNEDEQGLSFNLPTPPDNASTSAPAAPDVLRGPSAGGPNTTECSGEGPIADTPQPVSQGAAARPKPLPTRRVSANRNVASGVSGAAVPADASAPGSTSGDVPTTPSTSDVAGDDTTSHSPPDVTSRETSSLDHQASDPVTHSSPLNTSIANAGLDNEGEHELSLHELTAPDNAPDVLRGPSTRGRTTTECSGEGPIADTPQPLSEAAGARPKSLSTRRLSANRNVASGVSGAAGPTDASTAPGSTSGDVPTTPSSSGRLSYDERRKTFDGSGTKQEMLCAAGFSQHGNMYRCHSCDFSVNIEDTDVQCKEPWELHASRSPECEFVKENKSSDFIKNSKERPPVDAAERRKFSKKEYNSQTTSDTFIQNEFAPLIMEMVQTALAKRDEANAEKFASMEAEINENKHRSEQNLHSLQEAGSANAEKFASMEAEINENKHRSEQNLHSLQEAGTEQYNHMVLRTDFLLQENDQRKGETEQLRIRQKASTANGENRDREVDTRFSKMGLKQIELSEQQHQTEQKLSEMDERLQDMASTNETATTTPVAADPEPAALFYTAADDAEDDVDVEDENAEAVPEDNPADNNQVF